MTCAVVGGQFGSEGKGLIVSKIAGGYKHHVRVGAANAGHTYYDVDGFKRVAQQMPCAAFSNPDAQLYIGPGALISADILKDELSAWQIWRDLKGLRPRFLDIDARAQVITGTHIDREQQSGLAERIGSTSTIAKEGIGAAQAARVMRDETCLTAEDYFTQNASLWAGYRLCDVPSYLDRAERRGESVLLEGTQGTGLSLTTGSFPYVTSRNTTAAGLAADCGVPPSAIDRVILVVRTFPIRVAGPSGPFWFDSLEIQWDDIGIDPETERTTVTKKIRRVATFSLRQLEEAIILNAPTEIALMFCDYLDPGIRDKEEYPDDRINGELAQLIVDIESYQVPVTMLGTGPNTIVRRGE